MGYVGSEEFIRLQFEEYLLSLISAVKCHNFMKHNAHNPRIMLPQVDGDPSHDFGIDWIEAWSRSENYKIWDRNTDSHLFDIVEAKHPCAGGLTIDDVQKRVMEQVKIYHLDERFATGKEVLGRNLQAGKEKASTVFNKLYADMEARREAQRIKHEEAKREAERNGTPVPVSPGFAPDLNGAKQTVQSVSSKAGAYLGSWGSWVGEKRKTGWGRSASSNNTNSQENQRKEKENLSSANSIRSSMRSEKSTEFNRQGGLRPMSQESYGESIFDADGGRNGVHSPTGSVDLKPVDVTNKRRSRGLSGSMPLHPGKFHEVMDEEEEKKPTPTPRELEPHPKSEPAVTKEIQEVAASSREWEEVEVKSKRSEEDEHSRTRDVAAAVEAAAATPISP